MKIQVKEMIKIISINILIILFIFSAINIYIYHLVKTETLDSFLQKININITNVDESSIDIKKYETELQTVKYIKPTKDNFDIFCGEDRRIIDETKSNERPIVVLGCSYAYGHGIKREESLSYLLNRTTKRPIYNYSICASNILDSFEYLEKDTNKSSNEKFLLDDTEYVIYVYMYEHINRYLRTSTFYLHYEDLYLKKANKTQKLLIKVPLIRLISCIKKQQDIIKGYPFSDKSSIFLKHIILTIYEKIKIKMPKSKFIVVIYKEKIPKENGLTQIKYCSDNENSEIWKEIEEETDVKIVRTNDITGYIFDKKYKLEEDIAGWHPNAKAWSEFTPKFVSKYIK